MQELEQLHSMILYQPVHPPKNSCFRGRKRGTFKVGRGFLPGPPTRITWGLSKPQVPVAPAPPPLDLPLAWGVAWLTGTRQS